MCNEDENDFNFNLKKKYTYESLISWILMIHRKNGNNHNNFINVSSFCNHNVEMMIKFSLIFFQFSFKIK